jgi:hypothetical protein
MSAMPLRRSSKYILVAVTSWLGLTATLWPATTTAGVGVATSGPGVVDTALPTVLVDPVSSNAVYLGGQTVAFHWQTTDDHPSTRAADFLARVFVDGQIVATRDYFPETADYTWNWTVPEVTSGDVFLEVRAADAFGNLTSVETARFTVLRSVTDVPVPERGFAWADPAPNPFNPATRLAFHFPVPGRLVLKVYDPRGRHVRTLLDGWNEAGPLEVLWNGQDDSGRRQPGGVYLFALEYAAEGLRVETTRKAVLVP